jgi:hypothetical protein
MGYLSYAFVSDAASAKYDPGNISYTLILLEAGYFHSTVKDEYQQDWWNQRGAFDSDISLMDGRF